MHTRARARKHTHTHMHRVREMHVGILGTRAHATSMHMRHVCYTMRVRRLHICRRLPPHAVYTHTHTGARARAAHAR